MGELWSQTLLPPTPDSEDSTQIYRSTPPYLQGVNSIAKTHLAPSNNHLASTTEHYRRLRSRLGSHGRADVVVITGDGLSLADLVAVSCYRSPCQITRDEGINRRVNASVDFFNRHLSEGHSVYGINTGFGGSADTRSSDLINLQKALIQHHNTGVLLPSDLSHTRREQHDNLSHLGSHKLPRNVVRGAILIRCNSLMRGHSAVRLSVIEAMVVLLNRDFVPIIPLRGSISASGDLTPLAYIAGALEGNDDIYLDCRSDQGREILVASEALRRAGLEATTMFPKEGLALMNGTSVSCSAATLALYESQYIALISQALTAMCTEALHGSVDSFHPFISSARPHPGQIEAAQNIYRALEDSGLVTAKDTRKAGLYQDRYALRTASQWIGPQLEDLLHAQEQLAVELNSSTDNPLIDADEGLVHHGGNFQAASVTSATEKTRLSLHMLGKLLFAQSSELINPMLNKSLTPNLCFDDPSLSFTFKGVDINMAAYMSELAFLANPVSSHVQSAEMHNQAVNSLALISARYTLDAVEVVSLMAATHLYCLCQALDLRSLHIEYLARIKKGAQAAFERTFNEIVPDFEMMPAFDRVFDAIRAGLVSSKTQDTPQRARATAEATVAGLTGWLLRCREDNRGDALSAIDTWIKQLTQVVEVSIRETRVAFAAAEQGPTTLQYLGRGPAIMYRYIRCDLGIPLHKGLVEHPTYVGPTADGIAVAKQDKVTIGSRISVIYEALRSGDMHRPLIESLQSCVAASVGLQDSST